MTIQPAPDVVREQVRATYAAAAVSTGGATADDGDCCGSGCCGGRRTTEDSPAFGAALYDEGDRAELPAGTLATSLGCGNPIAIADLNPGDRVLDLGSGGGVDVLLSARRVGPQGYAYGVDMTDEMLHLARRNAAAAGVTNVEFRKGTIEEVPLPDASVDVVISNCVVNLSTDKRAVLAEAFRVLRPGGRVGISDVVADDGLSARDRLERGSWTGCVAGALSFEEYRDHLVRVGFEGVSVTATHAVADGMYSAVVRARKP